MESAACVRPSLLARGEGRAADGVTYFFLFLKCIPLPGNKCQNQALSGKHLHRRRLWSVLLGAEKSGDGRRQGETAAGI